MSTRVITAAQYDAIAAACDSLLRTPQPSFERVAVPWLHVLSEHPSNLAQYETLFAPDAQASRRKLRMRHAAGFARTLARGLAAHGDDPVAQLDNEPVDWLIVSHHVSSATSAEGAGDFYFGNLARDLAARGMRVLTVLLNQIPEAAPPPAQTKGATPRLVLPLTADVRSELDIMRAARRAQSDLLARAAEARSPFERVVAEEAALRAMSGATAASLRLHRMLERVCERVRPRGVLVTWEGHAWERLAFHAARTVDPSVRCIGYQHSVLLPRAHALKRSLGPLSDPDAIVTAGDVNRDLLRQASELRDIEIVTYGSHRGIAAAQPRAADATSRCIVIPEGLEPESLALFDFAIAAAARLPEVEFVLRAHPVLPFEQLAQRHSRLANLPPNVRPSAERDLGADLARCAWALYRGSSAALPAVLGGVRPLYIEHAGELPIDPLYAMPAWRRRVADVDALHALVRDDPGVRAPESDPEWQVARAFCTRYLAAPAPEVLCGLVPALSHVHAIDD